MAAHLASAGPLDGRWGGDRMQLTIDERGWRVEMDCAGGSIAGPVALTETGAFAASGSFEQYRGGPQVADVPAVRSNARYSGQVKDGVMNLSILSEGDQKPQVFTLRKGASVKLLRCL